MQTQNGNQQRGHRNTQHTPLITNDTLQTTITIQHMPIKCTQTRTTKLTNHKTPTTNKTEQNNRRRITHDNQHNQQTPL